MRFETTIVASAALALASASSLTGEATYYGGNVAGGACSFSTYTLPAGLFGTALSDSNWDTSANCGACVAVTGPSGNSITAMIVDECPGCGTNHLDLFPDAFAALADPTTGIIDISWEYVTCPITSALSVHNKESVSAYWFSMQVVNANQAVASMDVSTDGGSTWQATTRQTYNFFEQSAGFGTTTVDIKITSESGETVIVNGVNVASGASTTASSNFAASGSSSVVSSAAVAVVASPSTTEPASSTPVVEAAAVTTSSASAEATYSAGGVFKAVSSDSGSSSTTSTTTLRSTTTLYRTVTIPKSTSTSASLNSTTTTSSSSSLITTAAAVHVAVAANATTALCDGCSLSVMTISMCKPTVLYSVVPISSITSAKAIPSATESSIVSMNITIPAATATSTPTLFTSSASSMRVSLLLIAITGALTFLI